MVLQARNTVSYLIGQLSDILDGPSMISESNGIKREIRKHSKVRAKMCKIHEQRYFIIKIRTKIV